MPTTEAAGRVKAQMIRGLNTGGRRSWRTQPRSRVGRVPRDRAGVPQAETATRAAPTTAACSCWSGLRVSPPSGLTRASTASGLANVRFGALSRSLSDSAQCHVQAWRDQRRRLWLRLGCGGADKARCTFQDVRCYQPQTRHRYGSCPLLCRLADALSRNACLSAQIPLAASRRASLALSLYLSAISV